MFAWRDLLCGAWWNRFVLNDPRLEASCREGCSIANIRPKF